MASSALWTDDLQPGAVEVVVQSPGRPKETLNLSLEEGHRTLVKLPAAAPPASTERLVWRLDPTGASLYLDSQYLGPSPQTIDRPLATTRVRAQARGTSHHDVGSGARHSVSFPKDAVGSQAGSVDSRRQRQILFFAGAFSISLTHLGVRRRLDGRAGRADERLTRWRGINRATTGLFALPNGGGRLRGFYCLDLRTFCLG